jgi:hypothetical protein
MQPNDNPPINENTVPEQPDQPGTTPDDNIQERIDRLGGEAAPDITPEEFARLQQTGSLHIDSRGRVRANRRDETDPGLSLRKRRAWYCCGQQGTGQGA